MVASRIGQIACIIQDGRTGLLCAPSDSTALADALGRLRRQPDLRLQIGRDARAVALREYTWDARVETILRQAGVTIDPGTARGAEHRAEPR